MAVSLFETIKDQCLKIVSRCENPNCLTCLLIYNVTDENPIACKMSNLIYYMECKMCKIGYVNETSDSLVNRLNTHWITVEKYRNAASSSFIYHYEKHSMTDINILVLDIIENTDMRILKTVDYMYQYNLIEPNGLCEYPGDYITNVYKQWCQCVKQK